MYQQTLLIGHIGQIKPATTANGMPVTEFSVATSKSVKDKQTGNWVNKTEWHNCKAFKNCAEHVRDKLQKGDLVQLQGELDTRKYQDKQTGQDRYVTDLIVNDYPKKLPKFFTKDGSMTAPAATDHQSQQQPPVQQKANPNDQPYIDMGGYQGTHIDC